MPATSHDAGIPSTVLVVGGGLIGLCCAHFLHEQGANVTVLEAGSVGGGASRGNLGEIVPNLVAPLSAPGILRESALSVFKPDSAVFVHPRLSREMARFLVRFVRSTRSRTFRRSAAQLQALARDTFELFDELDRGGPPLGRNTRGFLYTFRTLAAAQQSLSAQHAIAGTHAELLSGREARALEPNLSEYVTAGYVLKDQWSLDPGAFVDKLTERLRRNSVAIVESARATSIRTDKNSVQVNTNNGTHEAETCVVAAGVWSRDLCRSLGLDLDLVAGKGYSFTVDLPYLLTRTVQFTDAHVVATPMGEQVRVAGTMELDRRRDHFSPGRITSIINAADPYLTGVDWSTRTNEWVGPRPMTGDGMPVIGRLPGEPRVVVAAGHNMHGLTLAPVTGRLVAQLMADPDASALHNPFDPSLHRRARRWRR